VFPTVSSRGAVVTLECVEKLIRTDMVDPVTGDKLREKDIIMLQRVSASIHPFDELSICYLTNYWEHIP